MKWFTKCFTTNKESQILTFMWKEWLSKESFRYKNLMAHWEHPTPPLLCPWKSPDAAVCCLKTASSIIPITKRQFKAWGIKSQLNLEFLNAWSPVADFCLLYISSSHYLQRSSGITFLCSASPEATEQKEKRTESSFFLSLDRNTSTDRLHGSRMLQSTIW